MSHQGSEQSTRTLLTESMIVATVPIIGYYAAYFYLREQAWILGISESFVSVSFDFVLAIGAAVGVALLILLMIIISMLARNPDAFGSAAMKANWMSLLVTPGCVAVGILASWSWYYVGLVVLAAWLFQLVELGQNMVLVGFNNKKSWPEIEASAARLVNTPIDRRVGVPVLFLLIVAFDICVGAKAVGAFNAEMQTWYLVEAGNAKSILLAKYGDDLIFKNKVTGAMTVKVLGKDEIPPLVAAKVGMMAVNR